MANNNTSNFKWEQLIVPGLIVGGLFIVKGSVLDPLLELLGLKDSKDEKQKQEENKKAADLNWWNPNYWRTAYPGKSVHILTQADAEKFAYQIYHAHVTDFGLPNFNDDEDAVYSVFRSLKYDTQLSRLAEVFAAKYGKDLLSFLYVYDTGITSGGFLNETEFNIVASIVKKYNSGVV
jgi:hypothetical protein